MKRCSQVLLIAVALLCAGSLSAQLVIPEIAYDSTPNLLKMPANIYLGEAVGVATNSKGHIFVYSRTGNSYASFGSSRAFANGAARLFEFDQTGKFVREIGRGMYGFTFAHVVRVDAQDNIWVVDEGSNMVIKFNPEGRVEMTMGRKAEEMRIPSAPAPGPPALPAGGMGGRGGMGGGGMMGGGRGGPGGGGMMGGGMAAAPPPVGVGAQTDVFNRPTDVAWDAEGNIFVSDGYGNSRVAKYDKNGVFIKSWGSRGTAPGQFNTPHTITTDAQGNVYVGDRGNKRIQVFDNGGEFKKMYLNVGAPWAVCISPGAHQYLFSSNSNGTEDMENGEIYKMELDGKILGKFGKGGKLLKEFGSVHEIDCRNPNELYVGEITNWRVQKLTLH